MSIKSDANSIYVTPLTIVASTIAARSIAMAVEALYPFGPVSDCFLARSNVNHVYTLVRAGGRRCIARLSLLRSRGVANAAFEAGLLVHLKSAGVKVSAPLATRTGAFATLLDAPEGPRTLMLFEFLPGATPDEALDDHTLMGAELARIHLAARDYAGPQSLYTLDLQHLLWRPLAHLMTAPTMDDALHTDMTALAQRLAARIAGMTGLTQTICHGDCHGFNTFIADENGQRSAAFFDFDDAGPGFLAYDLATRLWNLQQTGPASIDGGVDEKKHAKWRSFIAGYRAVAPIAEADFAAIAAFVSVRHMWYLGENAGGIALWGAQAMPHAWLQRQMTYLTAWESLATAQA